MVASIPPPALSELLPAFLAHIPASFASPKPPPSLPPLLTPLTRSRLTHLSFNVNSSNDESWLSLLTWSSNPSDGQTLQEHLASQDYYFLHQPPSPNTFCSKGYRRLDPETLQGLVEVPDLEIVVLYQFIGDDILSESGEIGCAWKVHDVRLADDEESFLVGGKFHGSIDIAEEAFRTAAVVPRYNSNKNDHSYAYTSALGQTAQEEEDSDDDYWGRYDDEETESCAGDQDQRSPVATTHHQPQTQPQSQPQSHVQIAASMLARRVLQDEETREDKEEEEYYARYANVEPVLDNPAPTATAATAEGADRRDSISTNITSASTTFDAQTMSTPLTAFTHPSAKVSPVMTATSHPKPEIATAKLVVAGLESAAEVHTQSEVAIQQHVSTSIKSLYRLWKAGGMDAEEFGKFLEREVEVLKVVEEAGELGS